MSAALGDVLPLALTVAIVPVSIITLTVLLLSRHPRSNAIAFTAGRILGLTVVVGAALFLGAGEAVAAHKGTSPVGAVLKVLAGVLLVVAGLRRWRRHRKDRGEPSLPGWMQRLDEANTALSLLAGFLVSVLEPLTLALAIEAGLSISDADLPFVSSLIVLAVFVLVATATNTVLLLVYLAGATWAEPKLATARAWITANHETVSIVVLCLLGAVLLGNGLPAVGA
jgi:threonine/homoserine/homoserine lactone efflux protein